MVSAANHAAKMATRMLRAKDAHDDLLIAAYRAQADTLEIEALTKIRRADEYDAPQDRGDVSRQGAHLEDGKVSTADLGRGGYI